MTDKLSIQSTEFRKSLSTQHCLISMLKMYIRAIFVDLSKDFYTLNHDLLIAKLGVYGFETDVLRYMKSYLMNRDQSVRRKGNFN